MAIYARLENGTYAEVTGVYKADGTEVTEIFQGDRLVYSATNEIYGTLPLYYNGKGYDLTDYLISGNTVQDGTPSPEDPVDAQGCGTSIMLNLGSTALPYEPYGFKLPLTVNGGEYPIYLGQVETTRRIKKLVLTGNERPNITNSTAEEGTKAFSFRFTTIGMTDILDYNKAMSGIPYPFFYSSHFKQKDNEGDYTDIKNGEVGANSIGVDTYNRYIIFGSSVYTTVDDFKSYLSAQYAAGTPVTVWYVLAEPETAIVNEPLMKIGDYADTISFAQAGVTIPTVNGANVLDMASTVKPSEVYIKGKGIKPTGYGQLTDVNGVNILDKDGMPIYVHGQ